MFQNLKKYHIILILLFWIKGNTVYFSDISWHRMFVYHFFFNRRHLLVWSKYYESRVVKNNSKYTMHSNTILPCTLYILKSKNVFFIWTSVKLSITNLYGSIDIFRYTVQNIMHTIYSKPTLLRNVCAVCGVVRCK